MQRKRLLPLVFVEAPGERIVFKQRGLLGREAQQPGFHAAQQRFGVPAAAGDREYGAAECEQRQRLDFAPLIKIAGDSIACKNARSHPLVGVGNTGNQQNITKAQALLSG